LDRPALGHGKEKKKKRKKKEETKRTVIGHWT
jgi:hypothetical protein